MGILAPLYLVEENPERLSLKTRREPFLYSIWLFCFSAVIFLMNIAVAPMAEAIRGTDPFFSKAIVVSLITLGVLLFALGLLLAGYRKQIQVNKFPGMIRFEISFWGMTMRSRQWLAAEILSFQMHNRTPKGYKPELYPRRRPVGYWTLLLILKNGSELELDRAPQEEEIKEIKNKIYYFWHSDEKTRPA